MGDVHLCVDVTQRRLLVVKWLRAELHEGSQAAIRFRREAELMTKANFPGVIKVCLLYTSPSPRDRTRSRMPSSA